MTIKLLIADDHLVVREGMRAMLKSVPDMDVVGEAEDGRQAVDLCRVLKPDLVIMDISMPVLGGVEATREIKAENPRVRVLALSMHTQKHFIQNVLEAGASGYLLKTCISEEIRDAIRKIIAGETYICSKISNVVVDAYVEQFQSRESGYARLSPRERQVVQLLAEGKRTKDIAQDLHISPRTVEVYRAQIMKKLNFESMADLVKFAIREGMTSLD